MYLCTSCVYFKLLAAMTIHYSVGTIYISMKFILWNGEKYLGCTMKKYVLFNYEVF